MKIGLLSDTHSYFDPKIYTYFKDCDEIWHAGDLGDMALLAELRKFKTLRAVYGNIDDKSIQAQLPLDLWFNCEGVEVWMTHIGGAPPGYTPRIKERLKQKVPQLFICGHSHILRIIRDPHFNGMLYVNPGAAGNHGFHRMKTLIRFEIGGQKISNMEVVEMGKRGSLEP